MGIVTDIFLPLALAFIMFALGLGLTGADFSRVIKQPKDFFIGSVGQIILLPIIAFILIKIWPTPPEIAILFNLYFSDIFLVFFAIILKTEYW